MLSRYYKITCKCNVVNALASDVIIHAAATDISTGCHEKKR